jgi:hypothetical protein
MSGKDPDNLLLAEVHGHRILNILPDNKSLKEIADNDLLCWFAYLFAAGPLIYLSMKLYLGEPLTEPKLRSSEI